VYSRKESGGREKGGGRRGGGATKGVKEKRREGGENGRQKNQKGRGDGTYVAQLSKLLGAYSFSLFHSSKFLENSTLQMISI
jgi:hypothetical protein